MQTTPPCDASQDVSTQTSDQPVSSLSLDVAVQTSSHSIHTSSLDAAVQTTSPSTLSQHVSTQMGSRLASSFSVDEFVQTPISSTVPHNYRSRSSLLDASSRTILLTAKTLTVSARHWYKTILVVSHLHFLTLSRLAPSPDPILTATISSARLPHVPCCSHRRDSNSMPRLQVSLLTPTRALHMAPCLYHLCGRT